MSQLEHDFRMFLSKHPEVEKCVELGLVNRRSLARFLIEKKLAKSSQLEATIAMLRRFEFKDNEKDAKNLFKSITVRMKDNIIILSFEKSKELVKKLQTVISHTDYDKGDTLKIVIGSSLVKVFIDEEKEKKIKELTDSFKLKNRSKKISEISLNFADEAIKTKGILSALTREFVVNDIVIEEFLTASPELLMYVKEEYVLKTYEIVKRFQSVNN